MARSQKPPWLLRVRSSTTFIIATVWMSSFTDFVLYAMIVPVMPSALVSRAGIPYENREYWVSVLLMSEAATALLTCPLFGYLLDISRTRRFPFLMGLFLLSGSMVLLAVARTVSLFVIARLLQGGATALVAVAGLSLLTDTVPVDRLGQTIGYLGSAITVGFLLGPLLGGLIYENLGYTAVFGVAFIMISIDFVLRFLVIEKKVAGRWIESKIDEDDDSGDEDDETRDDVDVDVDVDYGTLPRCERRRSYSRDTKDRPRPTSMALLQLVQQPRILITSWAFFVQGLVYTAFDATLPIFVERSYGWNTLGGGLIFIPAAISSFIEPFFGYLSDKHGTRLVTFTGFSLLCPTLISLRFIEEHTLPKIITLIILLFLVGVFMNLSVPALYVETQSVLEEMEMESEATKSVSSFARGKKSTAVAQAFSIQTMAQFAGLFVGPLWGGFVEYRYGWKMMALTLGLLAGVTAVPMLWLSGSSCSKEEQEGQEQEEQEQGEEEPLLRESRVR